MNNRLMRLDQSYRSMNIVFLVSLLYICISSDRISCIHAFSLLPSSSVTRNHHLQSRKYNPDSNLSKMTNKSQENDDSYINSFTPNLLLLSERRRNLLNSAIMTTLSTLIALPVSSYADIEGVVSPSFLNDLEVSAKSSIDSDDTSSAKDGVTLYTTKSGLKYIELREGNGPSPKYGNFVSISYKAYVKLPDGKSTNSKLQEYDSDPSYLIKHGNGRIIPGLDEGLHTMKVGGKRRIIIPPKLGYIGPGVLGPLPESPLGRYRLNKLLDEMIEVRGGNVVFDVELRSVVEDEADQGYYEDQSLTPEQFNTLRTNLQQKAKAARSGFDLLDSLS